MDDVLKLEQKHLEEVENKIQNTIGECERRAKAMKHDISTFICVDYEDRAKLSSLMKEQKALYTQAEQYQEYLDSPYFARMDFDVPVKSEDEYKTEAYYIGKTDISTYLPGDGKKEQLVVDWRSPVGECYYVKNQREFNVKGNHIVLVLKRAFDISRGKLKTYNTEYDGTVVSLEGDVVDQFLLTVLQDKRRVNRLTDIIRTIQGNQNDIIRKPLEESFIVQGCAGSGKTMILLHRLSTIIYNYRNFSPKNIVIITPNRFFDMHINELSRELGIGDIERFSVEEYYIRLIKRYDKRTDVKAQVESEKGLNQDLLREIYSLEYSAEMRELYDKIWVQMTETLQNNGFFALIKKANLKAIKLDNHSKDTYDKLISLYTSASIVAKEKNKEWRETRSRIEQTKKLIHEREQQIDEENERIPQLAEAIKNRLDTRIHELEAAIKQLDEQIDNESSETELIKRIETEQQTVDDLQQQIDDIDNNQVALTDISTIPGVDSSMKRVLMNLERDLITQYHKTRREFENTAVFRVGKRRELQEILTSSERLYREHAEYLLTSKRTGLVSELEKSRNRVAAARDELTEIQAAKERKIKRKSAHNEVILCLKRGYEELSNNAYRNFASVFSTADNEVLNPFFQHLNASVSRVFDLEKALKNDNKRLLIASAAEKSLEKEAFTDNELKLLDKCKRVIEQVNASNLSRNVLFRKLLMTYEKYEQEYKSFNYRHKLYLRLLLCSMYYPRAASTDRFINIDEAQDLALVEYKLFSTILGSNCIFNLYGDVNQNVYGYKGIRQWDELNFISDQIYTLNENYRNTMQITKYCNNEFATDVYPIGITGRDVEELSLAEAIECILNEKAKNPKNRCAIIYRYGVSTIKNAIKDLLLEGDSSWSNVDDKRISILTVEQAKGLEFDAVVAVVDHMTDNEKYISYTRALDFLVVVRDVFGGEIESEAALEDVVEEEFENLEDLEDNETVEESAQTVPESDNNEIELEVYSKDDIEIDENTASSLEESKEKQIELSVNDLVDYTAIMKEIEVSLSERYQEEVKLKEEQGLIALSLNRHENVIYVAQTGNRKSLLLNWFAYREHHDTGKQTILTTDSFLRENSLVLAEQLGLRAGSIDDMDTFLGDFSKGKYDIIFVPFDFFGNEQNIEQFKQYFKNRVAYWGIDNPQFGSEELSSILRCGEEIGSGMYLMTKPGNEWQALDGFKVVQVEEETSSIPIKKINLMSEEDKKKWIIDNLELFTGQGIIYCNDEADCLTICKAIRKKKIKAEGYIDIDKIENLERVNYLTNSFTQGGLPIIATTHEIGKNLTNPNMSFIIHYDIPERRLYETHVNQLVLSKNAIMYDLIVR